MKNFRKYILMILTSIALLGTTVSVGAIVGYADTDQPENQDPAPKQGPGTWVGALENGKVKEGKGATKEGVIGGVSSAKSGWMISLVDRSGQSALGSKPTFFIYQQVPPTTAGMITRFGENVTYVYSQDPIGFPPILSSNGLASGTGDKLLSWLKQPYDDVHTNADIIIMDYLGVPASVYVQALADNKDLYIAAYPAMWCNQFTGTGTGTKTGAMLCGTSPGMATQVTGAKTFVSRYTNAVLHKSTHLHLNWLGLNGTNLDLTDRQLDPSEFSLGSKNGYGMCMLKLTNSFQLVLSVNCNGKWTTFYQTCDNPCDVPDKFMGCDYVESTFSKKKTKLTNPEASYGEVVGSGEPTRPGGTGSQKFDLTIPEQALFVHYEGELEEPEKSEAKIYEWESNYVFPSMMLADREDVEGADNPFNLYNHIKEQIDAVLAKRQPCSKNSEYCPAHQQCTCYTVINELRLCNITNTGDGITDLTAAQKESKKWSVRLDADFGFSEAPWNLYREEIQGPRDEEWDIHKEALNKTNKWKVDQDLNSRFAYILTRSQLEVLNVAESRPEAGSDYALTINMAGEAGDWTMGHEKSDGFREMKFDTGTTRDVPSYDYVFTCQGYNLYIKYYYKHDGKGQDVHGSHQVTTTSGTTTTTTTVYEYCSDHGWPSSHPASYQDHRSSPQYHTFTENEWAAVTGSGGGQSEEKYLAGPTKSGVNTRAGDVVDSKNESEHLSGKFSRGGTFDYKPTSAQLVGSQFQNTTFKIVPEVLMTVWENEDADMFIGGVEKPVYVMGQFERDTIPSIAHAYIVSVENGPMEGIGSLSSAATGSIASKVDGYDLGVTASGTGFECHSTRQYRVDIFTIATNIDTENDCGANGVWGNTPTDPSGSHEEYVGSILGGLDQEMILKLEADGGNSIGANQGTKVYYPLLTTSTTGKRIDKDPVIIKLWFDNDGLVEGGGEVMACCGEMWPYSPGTAYSEAYQLEKMLRDMFESYNEEQNKSRQYNPDPIYASASANGGKLEVHGEHWYDEESQYKQRCEFYHTIYYTGKMSCDDKVDFGVLQQHYSGLGQTDSLKASFYTRLFSEWDYTAADGYQWPTTGTFRCDHVDGTDFSVVNQTTAQMKK